MFQIPEPIRERMDELENLVNDNPFELSVNQTAQFLRMDAECLRACIEAGKCPFALGWKKNTRGSRAFKIPTASFYFWYTVNSGMQQLA